MNSTAEDPTVIDRNKAVVLRLYDELLNRGRLSLTEEVFAADCVLHLCGSDAHGPAAVRAFAARIRRMFPGGHHRIDDLIGEDDRVVARITFSIPDDAGATRREPTGLPMVEDQIHIFRLAAGHIAEHWTAHRCGAIDDPCTSALHRLAVDSPGRNARHGTNSPDVPIRTGMPS